MTIYKKLNEYLENKDKEDLFKLIDYIKISDNLTNDDIKKICKEAEDNNFYSISILPKYIAAAHSFLKNEINLSALIDFPKGEKNATDKIKEIDSCNGVKEVNVVINYKLIKDEEDQDTLKEEIRKVSEYCHLEGVIMKAIIEIGALNYQQIEKICTICVDSNVDFIMTSTGKLSNDDSFETKLEKIKYMRKILPSETGIELSGGIRTIEQLKEVKGIVDRIGTSVIPQ